jgi:hypothetical protein
MAVLDAPARLRRLRACLRWHRLLGALACAAVLLWSLSGALHPLMSRYQPRPASFTAPLLTPLPVGAPALSAILGSAGIPRVTHARLVQLEDRPHWQVALPGAPGLHYFNAADGSPLPDGEARHARFLARHFLGERAAAISAVTRVEDFGGEYAWVNRLLPVYRVDFARPDGMRVYVEPRSAQLATLIDDRKALFNNVFVLLHTWRIPGLPEPLRLALAALCLLAVTATPVLGIGVWLLRRGLPVSAGLRRAHRVLGLTVALAVIGSGLSGAWHLAKGALDRGAGRQLPLRLMPAMAASALDTASLPTWPAPLLSLRLVDVEGRVQARFVAPAAASPAHHVATHAGHGGHAAAPPAPVVTYRALDGQPAGSLTDLDYVRRLVTALVLPCEQTGPVGRACAQAAPGAARCVDGFGGEYGFVNKLLPVWRFEAGDMRLYVHTETDALAARVTPVDYAEGWTFATLHKWQALDFLGRAPRDLLQIAWALMSALTALLGLRLLLRKPDRRA